MPAQNESKSNTTIGLDRKGRPLRAIVVDDEFSHRRIMVQILRSVGFDVIQEAENGEEALHYMGHLKPDILFMDYHMPRMEGVEALQKIRETDKTTKVVMFTTEVEKDKVVEILKLGASAYIVKPIDRLAVIKKLQQLLQPE